MLFQLKMNFDRLFRGLTLVEKCFGANGQIDYHEEKYMTNSFLIIDVNPHPFDTILRVKTQITVSVHD